MDGMVTDCGKVTVYDRPPCVYRTSADSVNHVSDIVAKLGVSSLYRGRRGRTPERAGGPVQKLRLCERWYAASRRGKGNCMNTIPSSQAAVPGLTRSDPHSPGITRLVRSGGQRYYDPSGTVITDPRVLHRIAALAIPPAWESVWISPDPLGHIQATGVDGRGRTQYRYHELWREQRDAQKFTHMLRFAAALPVLRAATVRDLRRHGLSRDRVAACAVRLIDLGLFRIGGERYAELDHHYGATTLEKRHVRLTRDGGMRFDYIAKEGKRREVTVTDSAALSTVRALARSDNGHGSLFCWEHGDSWQPLRSSEVTSYIAEHADGHFTAKEFRTWNATVLMALQLANAKPSSPGRGRKSVVAASVREVAGWLGDTPAVARASYIHPALISRYESDGRLPTIPLLPAVLPAAGEAEAAIAALLAAEAPAPAAPGSG